MTRTGTKLAVSILMVCALWFGSRWGIAKPSNVPTEVPGDFVAEVVPGGWDVKSGGEVIVKIREHDSECRYKCVGHPHSNPYTEPHYAFHVEVNGNWKIVATTNIRLNEEGEVSGRSLYEDAIMCWLNTPKVNHEARGEIPPKRVNGFGGTAMLYECWPLVNNNNSLPPADPALGVNCASPAGAAYAVYQHVQRHY